MRHPLRAMSPVRTTGTRPTIRGVAARPDSGAIPGRPVSARLGLPLVVTGGMRGPEKYRILESKRRRAQIRARRALELA